MSLTCALYARFVSFVLFIVVLDVTLQKLHHLCHLRLLIFTHRSAGCRLSVINILEIKVIFFKDDTLQASHKTFLLFR